MGKKQPEKRSDSSSDDEGDISAILKKAQMQSNKLIEKEKIEFAKSENDDFEVVEQKRGDSSRSDMVKSKKIKKDKKHKKKKKSKKVDSDTENEEIQAKNPEFNQKNNFYTQTYRQFTVTIVIPASIVDNAQSMELKTYLVGQIAKAATIFQVNEIVVLSNDKSKQMKGMMQDLTTTEFFVQNLEYLETP